MRNNAQVPKTPKNTRGLGEMKLVTFNLIDTTKAVSGLPPGRHFTLEDRPSSWPTIVSPFLFPIDRSRIIVASVDAIYSKHGKLGMVRVMLWCKLFAAGSHDDVWQLAKERALGYLKDGNYLVKVAGIASFSEVCNLVRKASNGLVIVIEGNLYCRLLKGSFSLQDYGSGYSMEEYLARYA